MPAADDLSGFCLVDASKILVHMGVALAMWREEMAIWGWRECLTELHQPFTPISDPPSCHLITGFDLIASCGKPLAQAGGCKRSSRTSITLWVLHDSVSKNWASSATYRGLVCTSLKPSISFDPRELFQYYVRARFHSYHLLQMMQIGSILYLPPSL